MIRHYERVGLIEPVPRTRSNYRTYTDHDVHILRFVRSARGLGFSVVEIGSLLNLWRDKSRNNADVEVLVNAHVARLRAKIEQLEQMSRTLETFVESSRDETRPDCPILDGIEGFRVDEKSMNLPTPRIQHRVETDS